MPLVIKANRVSNAAKINLGIGVYDYTRTPVLAPESRPLIAVLEIQVRRHQLRFIDSVSEQKTKPAGVQGLQVFYHVGDAPPVTRWPAASMPLSPGQPWKLEFKPEDSGKTAYYHARWQTFPQPDRPLDVPGFRSRAIVA